MPRTARKNRRRRRGGGLAAAARKLAVPGGLTYLQTRRRRRGTRGYRKGSRSRTRPGRQDFVTHLGSNVFDRLGHWFKGTRKPYRGRKRRRRKRRRRR